MSVGSEPDQEVKPDVHAELRELALRFGDQRLVRVSDRVHQAVGYDLANITFIEADASVIAIDAGFTPDVARAAMADYASAISGKPVRALLYSHGHGDHVGGAQAFADAAGQGLEVYAASTWREQQRERVAATAPHFRMRAYAMLGFLLPDGPAGRVPTGAGPIRAVPRGGLGPYVSPTHEIDGETELEVDGVRMLLIPMPSETGDQMLLWLPDDRVAFAADVAAGVLPILSTPRNEPGRVPMGFVDGIERLMSFPIGAVAAGHNMPLIGEEAIDALQSCRDAAQFVLDQTMRALNMNLTMEAAAAFVQLPPHLAAHPLLRETYHRLAWIVKGIYTQAGGWYGGDAATLDPLGPAAEAEHVIEMGGGVEAILRRARRAGSDRDHRWAAQLAGYILRAGSVGEAATCEARAIKAAALRAMAYGSCSGNQRNFMLTEALELEGAVDMRSLADAPRPLEQLRLLSLRDLLRLPGTWLDPARCSAIEITAGFRIAELGQEHRLTVRRGVLHYRGTGGPAPEVVVELAEDTLVRLVGGHLSWAEARARGLLTIGHGSPEVLERFLSCFDAWRQRSA